MQILDEMTITEAAELIRLKAIEVKKEKNITEQEAFKVILSDIEKHLGGTSDDIGVRG